MNEDRAKPGPQGEARKAHYGDGKQPWDSICELGWGCHFAAANVLKYLRRTKDTKHSLESARWYYVRLIEMAEKSRYHKTVLRMLHDELKPDELTRLVDF